MQQPASIPTTSTNLPTVSQLLYTHRRLTDLARGPLSDSVADEIHETANTVVCEIAGTPSASWHEFAAKVSLLLEELTTDPTEGWLDAIRESVRADVERLEA
jgi:cytochrome P450